MFVPDDPFLIGNRHGDLCIVVEDDALAAQPAFQARIDRAIDEVFFLIRYPFEEFFSFFYIQVAGGTSANASAIVIQVNIVLFGDFENGQVFEIAADRSGRNARIFKKKCYSSHKIGNARSKSAQR